MLHLFNPHKTFTGLSCVDTRPSLCSLGMHAVYHPILCYYSNRMLLAINMLSIKCMTLSFPSHSVTAGETPDQRTEATQSLLWLGGNAVCGKGWMSRLFSGSPAAIFIHLLWMIAWERDENTVCKNTLICISNKQSMTSNDGGSQYVIHLWLTTQSKKRLPSRHAVLWMI